MHVVAGFHEFVYKCFLGNLPQEIFVNELIPLAPLALSPPLYEIWIFQVLYAYVYIY